MSKEKESDLVRFKKDYTKLQKKYFLPSFEDMNQDFSIEKAAEFETDYLIREIRKLVVDKVYNYLRFIETLLNPVNGPMSVFSIIKAMNADDKKRLEEAYKKLVKNEIQLIKIDMEFSEKGEAEFIKKTYKLWQGVKEDISSLIKSVEKNWDNKFEVNRKGYFG